MANVETKPSMGCMGCFLPLGLAFAVYVGSIQWGFYVQDRRNGEIATDVNLVARSLASFAYDHQGLYPEGRALVAGVQPYLPDLRMPPNPWSADGAALPVLGLAEVPTNSGLDQKAWPSAAALVAGAPLPVIGVHLYQGRRGTLIYDVTPDRRAYVLYGLGERSSPDSPFPLKTPKLVGVRSAGIRRLELDL